MTINKIQNGTKLTLSLEGRLDTTTAPVLEGELKELLPDTEELVFNFEKLEYISSAGLRVLLHAQKTMSAQGSMKITNVDEVIMEIFEITGFAGFLAIE